ncbi:MAG: MBL fold metallo-hydrolase [Betaproteobacteria bacterium]|jgi:glyoxylase-like metal-dependent hydrolase (beta-lactamase superfamily II)
MASMIMNCLRCMVGVAALLPAMLPAQEPLQPQKVAEDVYAFIGDSGEITAANRGFVGNSGFLVGPTGVVVIDTGVSYRHGRQILEAIARVTDKPVELVIITHAVQEFLFGNAAFDERGIALLAHRETTKLMKARCAHCLENLKPILGEELTGTRLILPNREVDATTAILTGGRHLELIYLGWASTPGDLVVVDTESGVMFGGGMVCAGRIPDIRDSDFEGWQRALRRLEAMKPARVVPGYGPVSGPEAITQTAAYLDSLDRVMKSLYSESSSLLDSVEKSALPAYHDWPMYASTHRRNALHRYLQLELQDLGGDPRSTALPQR